MPQNEEELRRIHIWLYDRDVERLDAIYGKSLGRSTAIRSMVRKMLNIIEAKSQATALPVPIVEDDNVESSE